MANQNRYWPEIERLCVKWHWTAEQIHKELKKTYFFIGIGSVYRILQDMVNAWILMKTQWIIDKVIYETTKPPHWHLHCKVTGWILDVDTSPLESNKFSFPEWFTLDEVNVVFNGWFYKTGDNCSWEVVKK